MGPCTVMGFDKYTVLVKQSGSVFKCHQCHLKKVKSSSQSWDYSKESEKKANAHEKPIELNGNGEREESTQLSCQSDEENDTALDSLVQSENENDDNENDDNDYC